jgi:transposase
MEGYIKIEEYHAMQAMLQAQVDELKSRLEQLNRMVFGAKSERYIPDAPPEQLSLFGGLAAAGAGEAAKPVAVAAHERKQDKKKPARLKLPAHLKREETIIEPDIDTSGMVRIGEERTETLKYTPAQLSVKVIVRPKYAKKPEDGEGGSPIAIAELPPRFIDKCIADESLLGAIITDKYVDHIPLYRTAARLARLGVPIPLSTMCGWAGQCASAMRPLFEALVREVLRSGYLQADETRIEVVEKAPKPRGRPKKGKTHRGYLWGYHAVGEKLAFFDYSPTREADNPLKHLKGFKGSLQTDCYDVYDQVREAYGIEAHLHCLSHARREFEKALGNDAARAGHAMVEFQKLYAVERKAREEGLSAEGISALRQKEAKPVLEKLFVWMAEESPKLPPSSPAAKAMGYMLKRKERMMRYLSDGRLRIDTNAIENLIRPIAVGRRNYLFAGSHEGAQRAAMFYSFFACCKLNGVAPGEWLADVMRRLPAHPINRIGELLPHRWQQQPETAAGKGV